MNNGFRKKELTKEYGKGFDRSNLYRFLSFYKNFPQIVDALSRQSGIMSLIFL